MDRNKLAKIALKVAVGATVSCAIGYAIKGEKVISAKIDEMFATTKDIVNP